MADRAFFQRPEGYGLTTANIHYRLPDHPSLLQSYVWQDYDIAPAFPELRAFLAFWARELDGPIHSVEVAHKRLPGHAVWQRVDGLLRLN